MAPVKLLCNGSIVTYLGEHFVSLNQTHSPSLNLNIGPLLFLIYINDIINSSNILSFVVFADDTTVYVQQIQLMVQFKSLTWN